MPEVEKSRKGGEHVVHRKEKIHTDDYIKTSGITGEKTIFLKLNGGWGGKGWNTQDKLETHGEKK